MYKRERCERETKTPQRRRTPSFSSILLDSICNSLDESNGTDFNYESLKEQSVCNSVREENERMNLHRGGITMREWMHNSASSDSSSSAAFSSSEPESKPKPKPVRFRVSVQPEKLEEFEPRNKNLDKDSKQKLEFGGFSKTKLRALKIYSELKKVKQPISPGGRISNFLNSIFNSGNVKKAKMCYVGAVEDVNMEFKNNSNNNYKSKSPCSSGSSYSRSCLSKSTSSRGKLSSGSKRSVRFYPISVIVDEDLRPCGHKSIYREEPILMAKKSSGLKFSEVVSVNKKELKNYVKDKDRHFLRNFLSDHVIGNDDDDDVESCSSSDLFELDHIVGIGRYNEELPVYGTTSLRANQAIANGFLM